jgi:hypothetical protein
MRFLVQNHSSKTPPTKPLAASDESNAITCQEEVNVTLAPMNNVNNTPKIAAPAKDPNTNKAAIRAAISVGWKKRAHMNMTSQKPVSTGKRIKAENNGPILASNIYIDDMRH